MKRIAKRSYGYGYSYGFGGQEQQQQQQQEEEEDRLTSLSDDLLISILSHVDTKLAVQSSILSKRWVNLWTLLPVLNFNCEEYYSLDPYTRDYFLLIHNVFARHNSSIPIDRLSIKVNDVIIMARVFRDALLHGVSDLSIDTSENIEKYHRISCVDSCDSLTSLSLKGMLEFCCFPRFNGLVKLKLERVKIFVIDPFSSFPNLGELFLINCKMETGFDHLKVVAFRLSRLTISSCFHTPDPYARLVLLTPNLSLLEIDGLVPMSFEAIYGLPVLHTVHMDSLFSVTDEQPEYYDQQKLNLISIFGSLKHAECVHLSPSTVELLSKCESMLVEEHCPFEYLKVLNLIPPPNKPAPQLDSFVSDYLLNDHPKTIVKSFPRCVRMAHRPTRP